MKPVVFLKSLALIATTLFAVTAIAYNDDKKKEICRPPKIQEFTLPVYSESNKIEAQPESEFTFVVSGWANPKKFKLSGKGKDIPFTVKSTETFHKIHAKLLPEFTGQTVRINTRIPAVLECYSTVGWLVKVADKVKTPEIAAPEVTSTPAANAQSGGGTANTVQPKSAESSSQTAPVAKSADAAPKTETPSADSSK